MGRTYEVAKGSAEAAMTGADAPDRRRAARGLRAVSAVRPPRRAAGVRRLLLLQQRGHRRRDAGAARDGGDPRHRLPPRQRHAGVLRGAEGRLHLLDPRRSGREYPYFWGYRVREGQGPGRGHATSTSRCLSGAGDERLPRGASTGHAGHPPVPTRLPHRRRRLRHPRRRPHRRLRSSAPRSTRRSAAGWPRSTARC